MRGILLVALWAAAAGQTRGPVGAYLGVCGEKGEDSAATKRAFSEVVPVMIGGGWAREARAMGTALRQASAPGRRCAAGLFSLVGQTGQGTTERLRPVLNDLLATLRDPEGLVQFGAATALAGVRPHAPPELEAALVKWLPYLSGGTQAVLLMGLARIPEPAAETLSAFVTALGTKAGAGGGPRSGALAGLAENQWRHAEMMGLVIEALESGDRLSRQSAVKVVARYGAAASEAALPRLRRMLEDRELADSERREIRLAIAALGAARGR